ncbi:MAG: hypothetical protein OIF38_11525 [Cellvibrionaceae bacterium]|nr:hypothetical protein [Cellvibrionaceae bacterium]
MMSKLNKISLTSVLVLLALTACSASAFFGGEIKLSKKVDVFGVAVLAAEEVPDQKLLHAAKVLAQYLDNNEDGLPDNLDLVQIMSKNNAVLVMVMDDSDIERVDISDFDLRYAQDLYASETHPNASEKHVFDGSIEEVLHLISRAGYEQLYPEIFGVQPGSSQSEAMDLARGGHFQDIPDEYPEEAWYCYYDETCDYECQGGEYFYWALTSLLGGQNAQWRRDEIDDEWKLPTFELLKKHDTKMYNLLTDPKYKMPTKLPDGEYKGMTLEILAN